MPTIQIPTEKWSGTVREVTLGATAAEGGSRVKTITVGGESTLPFLHFEGAIPHPPVIAVEIQDRRPADWSPVLLDAWGTATEVVEAWAKAAEATGADLILLKFSLDSDPSAEYARRTVRRVLEATGLPLIVFGPGQADLDNEILVAVAEEAEGEPGPSTAGLPGDGRPADPPPERPGPDPAAGAPGGEGMGSARLRRSIGPV